MLAHGSRLAQCVSTRTDGNLREPAVRARLFANLGLDTDDLVLGEQVHGSEVARVGRADIGGVIAGADALITDEPGMLLGALFADCVPVLLWSDAQVGLAHAGWRGTAAQIARKTVEAMQVDPGEIHAYVGPAIGGCCYEVGPEVAAAVGRPGWKYVPLATINKEQLVRAGVPAKNIETSGICTSCRNDLYFSHRKGDKERFGAFIGLLA